MSQKAANLCDNIAAVADTAPVMFLGGKGVLIVEATTYPTTCILQTQSRSTKWVNVGSNISSDGLYSLDLPAGMYRIHMAGGAVAAFYATLVSVPAI